MKDYLQHFDRGNPLHAAWFNAVIDALAKADPEALAKGSELDDLWRSAGLSSAPIRQTQIKEKITEWKTLVKALNLSQPDASTCQSACIAMAVGDRNIQGIRQKLLQISPGAAGSPDAMGDVIMGYKVKYEFVRDASLRDVIGWLKAGELLITHGWFTRSGHVICLDGVKEVDNKVSFNVKDPWSEFNAPRWKYDGSSKFYDGFYSELCIYAACVASSSAYDAEKIYNRRRVDRSQKAMWVHRIKP